MRRIRTLLAAVIFTASVPLAPAGSVPPSPTVVVADLGWSINPYHEAFRRPLWTQPPAIPGLGSVTPLPLTLGSDYTASRAADTAVWETYQSGTLYWIPQTNLLLLTIRPNGVLPDGATEASFHGAGTSAVIADECRDCTVLFVQDAPVLDGTAVARIVDEMPWVDLVVSTNQTGDWLGQPIAGHTRRLYDSGRIFFAATGNYAVTSVAPGAVYHHYSLPPWVVSVGGARPECLGTDPRAGRPPEIVGRFVTDVAVHATVTGRSRRSGTSFAAPQVAAGLANVLLDVRRALGDTRAAGALWSGSATGDGVLADGKLTAQEIRTIAWSAARRYATDEFDLACITAESIAGEEGVPMPVSATPWVEMGWGYFGVDEVDSASAMILEDESMPVDGVTQTAMSLEMNARLTVFGSPD